MNGALLALLAPLARQQAPDTIVAVLQHSGLDAVADWATIILAMLMTGFVAGLTVMLFEVRKVNRTVRGFAREALRRADPVLERSLAVGANLEFITTALRTDVERLNSMVRNMSDRLEQASERVEERIGEFNALMEVVQGEAEDIFIDTASTARGIRVGARTLSDAGSRPRAAGELPAGQAPPPLTGRTGSVETEPAESPGAVFVTSAEDPPEIVPGRDASFDQDRR